MLDPFTTANPLQDRSLLVLPFSGNDQMDRLANRLLGLVAEEPLGPGIPGEDPPLERLADDRILRRLNNRGQKRLGLVSPALLADIAED